MNKQFYMSKNHSHRRIDLAWNKSYQGVHDKIVKVNTMNLLKSKPSSRIDSFKDLQTSILQREYSAQQERPLKTESGRNLGQLEQVKKRLNSQSPEQQPLKTRKFIPKITPLHKKSTQCLEEQITMQKHDSSKKLSTLTLKNIPHRYIKNSDIQEETNSLKKFRKLQSSSTHKLDVKKNMHQRFNIVNHKFNNIKKKEKTASSCLRLRQNSQEQVHYSTVNSKEGGMPIVNLNSRPFLKLHKQNRGSKPYLLPVKQEKHLNYMKLKDKICENIISPLEPIIDERTKSKSQTKENSITKLNTQETNPTVIDEQPQFKLKTQSINPIPSLNCSTISQCRDSNSSFFSQSSQNYINQMCKDQALPQIKKIIEQKDKKRKIDIEKLRKKFPNDFFKK